MVEHGTPNPAVGGSSPPCPALFIFIEDKMKLGEAIKFLKEVREELKKVSWPSKELVRNATVAVIVFTIILSVYLWSLDLIFKRIFDFIFR